MIFSVLTRNDFHTLPRQRNTKEARSFEFHDFHTALLLIGEITRSGVRKEKMKRLESRLFERDSKFDGEKEERGGHRTSFLFFLPLVTFYSAGKIEGGEKKEGCACFAGRRTAEIRNPVPLVLFSAAHWKMLARRISPGSH